MARIGGGSNENHNSCLLKLGIIRIQAFTFHTASVSETLYGPDKGGQKFIVHVSIRLGMVRMRVSTIPTANVSESPNDPEKEGSQMRNPLV